MFENKSTGRCCPLDIYPPLSLVILGSGFSARPWQPLPIFPFLAALPETSQQSFSIANPKVQGHRIERSWSKGVGICVLGALQGINALVRLESLHQILKKRIPSRFLDINERTLQMGAELAETAEVQTH